MCKVKNQMLWFPCIHRGILCGRSNDIGITPIPCFPHVIPVIPAVRSEAKRVPESHGKIYIQKSPAFAVMT
ncbi:MAG: hypothetical protein SVZ03_02975 [Spirochaetota bacterium]|nr:hypothetical protein [Spirochaetota bacterium]